MREIRTSGSVRGEGPELVTVNLGGHEAGNGGNRQGEPIDRSGNLLYSEGTSLSLAEGC
jgi:hypothetical protein